MKKNSYTKKALCVCASGFTLAEVMIVLVVIGVITGILLPTAIQNTPDKNIMKFKKGYSTLGKTIRELVTSDLYYKDGDLGLLPDGNLVNSVSYFCETFADIVNIKRKNCSTVDTGSHVTSNAFEAGRIDYVAKSGAKEALDILCKDNIDAGEEIVTSDDIVFYQTSPSHHFGVLWQFQNNDGSIVSNYNNLRLFNCTNPDGSYCFDLNSYDQIYKIFCMDIDSINKGEEPFGFGIRADGRILNGARADVWLDKDIQKSEE